MDINDKIAENVGLVYKQLSRFNLAYDQDAESFAYEALYRAVLTYDESSGNAFSTYATCCIANALRKHLRTKNKKRQLEVVSYYEPSFASDDGYLLDTLRMAEDAESIVLANDLYAFAYKAYNEVLNELTEKQRAIVTMWYDKECNISQCEIAAALHISQPVVSRALSCFKYKLSLKLEEYA